MPPEMKPVQSSLVKSIGYDAAREELAIQFNDGRFALYDGVPASTYEQLENAPSVGKAFHALIRGQYNHRYV